MNCQKDLDYQKKNVTFVQINENETCLETVLS